MRKTVNIDGLDYFVDYRLPNIAEGPRFLNSCGFNSKKLSDKKWIEENELELLACSIENAGKFITKIHVTHKGKKIKDYEDLLEVKEMQTALYAIASEILESVAPLDDKKKA